MSHFRSNSTELPSDKDTLLQLMVLALLEERDQQKQRAEEQKELTEVQQQRADQPSAISREQQIDLRKGAADLYLTMWDMRSGHAGSIEMPVQVRSATKPGSGNDH